MSACSDWQEQLTDLALGQPTGLELTAHLERCAACAAALIDLRARVERLDGAVRGLVASEPPPYLAARVHAEIKPVPAWFGWIEWWRPALATLALAAGLVGVVSVVRGGLGTREPAETVPPAVVALFAWRSPTDALLRSPVDPLLKTVPQLGEYYLEVHPRGREPREGKGGKNAS